MRKPSLFPPVEAVIFDCDGVLVDSTAANIATYQNLCRKAGYTVPSIEAVQACLHLDFRGIIEQLLGKDACPEQLGALRHILSNEDVRATHLLRFPPGLFDVLSGLGHTYKLGIATSRSRLGIRDVFNAAVGLEDHFDSVVTTEDYARPKPAPEPLQAAAQRLGTDTQSAIYVGDNPTDMEAAYGAGMRAVCLSAGQLALSSAWIRSFEELPAAINGLAR